MVATVEREMDQPAEVQEDERESTTSAPRWQGQGTEAAGSSSRKIGSLENINVTSPAASKPSTSRNKRAQTAKVASSTSVADAFFANLASTGGPHPSSPKPSADTLKMKARQNRAQKAREVLPGALRSLKYRSVLLEDIKDAEKRFYEFTKGLDEEIIVWEQRNQLLKSGRKKKDVIVGSWQQRYPHPRQLHKDTLRSHLNHLLYLSARAGSQGYYLKFIKLFEEYGIEQDSWTYLTRLMVLDRRSHVSLHRITDIWKEWKAAAAKQAQVSGGELDPRLSERSIQDETVLVNQTIWMLAKRGNWRVVGPVYHELLQKTATNTMTSIAFPAEYFDPSNVLSVIYPAFHQAQLDKITYQGLIRALGFHGNVIPALNVMGDMLRDERGYIADLSDYVAILQGFARFGNSLEPVEAQRRRSRRLSFHMDADQPEDLLELFPPLIYPQLLPVDLASEHGHATPNGLASSEPRTRGKTGGLRKLTEIWASKIDGWIEPPGSADAQQPRLPGLDISILTKVFRAMLGTAPVARYAGQSVRSASFRYHAASTRQCLAPSPRAIYIILIAFARCSDGDPEVLKSVWADLEDKFGLGNQEGWVGWKVDKRLSRIAAEISGTGI
jgi:hypothetical protein